MTRGQFRGPAPARVVWDGQSMNVSPDAPNNIPTFAMAEFPTVPWSNIAIAGAGWKDLTDGVEDFPDSAAQFRRDPLARNREGCIDILVMNGGQGDMLNPEPSGQADGPECYQRALDYAASARAAGFTYVVGVTWPAIGPIFGRPTTSEQEAMDYYNAALLDDPESWDGIVDISSAPFDDATDLGVFMFDRTHLDVPGARLAAARFVPAIRDLLPA